MMMLADNAFLVAWWFALAILIPFVPWAWMISSKLDKDARFFHLNRQAWNGAYLGCGVAALVAMLAIPWIWVGWPVGVLILYAPVLAYWKVRNNAVPEEAQFSLTGEGIGAKLEAAKRVRATREALVTFTDASDHTRRVPLKEDPEFPIHLLTEDILLPALKRRAYRLDVQVTPKGTSVAQIIDGVRYKRDSIPAEDGAKLVDFLKDLAGQDVNDRRRRQTGTFRVSHSDGSTLVALTTSGSSSGIAARLEFNRRKQLIRPFDELGLLDRQLESLKFLEEKHEQNGIVLLGAPSGQGLSTSAYSFVNHHDAYTSNIKTLERDVQVQLEGVDHTEWNAGNTEVEYATNLQSILRRDPDIVLVSTLTDAETAKLLAGEGRDGPLVYVPQRATSVADQIKDWVKLVGDVKKAASPLRVVINQRLVRKVCPNCRQPYQPSADQLKKLNIPADKARTLYRASGKVQVKNKIENCDICDGTGYFGQTGVFEVMIVDKDVRQMLAAGDLKGAMAQARRNKMILLQEAALAKVVSGDTTIEEVIRVISGGGGGSSASPSTKPPVPAAT